MKINEQLSNYEQKLLGLMKEAKIHLAELPEGELRNYPTTIKGITYNKFYVVNNGKRKYMPKESMDIKLLAEKMFYEKLLDDVRLNLDELNLIKNNIPDISLSQILCGLPEWVREYIDIPQSHDLLLSPDPAQAKILLDWQNAPYRKKDNHRDGLKHRITDEIIVRSKSEGLILGKIKELKIAYRYECGIEYEPSKWIFPDITMMRTDTKLYYLEHCGLMNSAKYIEDLKWKLNVYEKLGIVPWDNLILTFDDANGIIDVNLIEAILKSKLIL